MFRSATFKLTLWYLAIIMAISIVFSIVLYHVAANELMHGLHRETQRIYNQFPVFQGSPLLKPGPDFADSAHDLLLRLLVLNVFVFVAAGLASYLLARRTLSPIEIAHEQQRRFTADVSHELRTPLTAIRMESEVALLSEQTNSIELRLTLASNLEEVEKLETLINNLLRLTRLEESKLRHNFQTVHSTKLVTDAIAQIEKNFGNRQLRLQQDVHDFQLDGDYDSLVQLLVLILDNAGKYSLEKSTVEFTAKTVDQTAIFMIIDHGIGIEPEALTHIFERFYRAESSRSKLQTTGYGLGLSIAKMIADVHHGDITLASSPGTGTTVTISLPLHPSASK